MNSTKYLYPLEQSFRSHANPGKAKWMSAYLLHKFAFLGITFPDRRHLQKEFFDVYGYPERDNVNLIAEKAWQYPEREFQHFAVDLLIKYRQDYREEDIFLFEKLITDKSWWDTVDALAGWIIGPYFLLFPENIKVFTGKWVDSDNIWLQRAALLFQLKYKKDMDFELLSKYILKLKHSKEFFIRKAIGWILREYSKFFPEAVISFVKSHKLPPLSTREALRIVKKKGII